MKRTFDAIVSGIRNLPAAGETQFQEVHLEGVSMARGETFSGKPEFGVAGTGMDLILTQQSVGKLPLKQRVRITMELELIEEDE